MITYTTTTLPTRIEITPDVPALGSVIWLHGLGASGRDFVSIAPQLALPDSLPLRFIFPHAPVKPITVNNGARMRAWFDIDSFQILERHVDEQGIADSVKLVGDWIEDEKNNNDIPTEKIIVGGFSQGAVIALRTGLSYHNTLGGIIALSGFLPNAETIIKNRNPANKAIPVFIAHGTEDTIVPHALGETVAVALQKENLPVSWYDYAIPHSLCIEEIQAIAAWLIKQIR